MKRVKVTQSCPTLCNPMDYSPPGSPVDGITRSEYWREMSFPSPGDLPKPENEPRSPALQADSLLSELPEKNLPKKQILFLTFFFFFGEEAMPCGMWDLSSQTRDQTCVPCSGSTPES